MRAKNKVLRVLYVLIVVIVSIVGLMSQNSGTITVSGGAGGSQVKVAVLQHQRAFNERSDSTEVYGWNTMELETVQFDNIGITQTGDSTFTLPAGTYLVTADVIDWEYRSAIYNVTDDIRYPGFGNTTETDTRQSVACAFTIASAKDFEFQIWTSGVDQHFSTSGLNTGTNDNIYWRVEILKL